MTVGDGNGGRGGHGIGSVARMLGVSEATLRSWEQRYGVVVPERTTSGQRRYSAAQVEQLRAVMARLGQGQRAADAFADVGRRSGAATAVTQGQGASRLALVAERSEPAAEAVVRALRARGWAVTVTLDPGDVERRAAEVVPDVIIVELLIGGGDGIELCRRLRAASSTPIVALSALEAGEQAQRAGADAFLAKPVDPAAVADAAEALSPVARRR